MRRAIVSLILIIVAVSALGQPAALLRAKLERTIDRIDEDFDGVLGVGIRDLTSGETILRNGDTVFPIASSIKIAVLLEMYRQIDSGKIDPKDTYTLKRGDIVGGDGVLQFLTPDATTLTMRDLATLMIVRSDNTATNILIERLGFEAINAILAGIDLKETRLRRKMMDSRAAAEGRENTASPREMLDLLEAIHRGRVLPESPNAAVVELLSTPRVGFLNRRFPPGVRVASKSGTLDGVRTESGIVFVKDRPFAITIMTTFARNGEDAEETIAAIAEAAHAYFARLARSSAHGRALR